MNTNLFPPMEVKECDYKGEHYSAREDGFVMRHSRTGMRKRKLDDVWTPGVLNASNGYLFIGTSRVHIIIATAFHGPRDSSIYVVDHIDNNKQNNRPENLRWLTRLENALYNEITYKKILLRCGSIEAFLENPSILNNFVSDDPNFKWMRSVTKEEAKNCLENWTNWARTTTAVHDPNYKNKEIGDWIYQKPYTTSSVKSQLPSHKNVDNTLVETSVNYERDEEDEDSLIKDSNTPLAAQYHWTTPTDFPCCPDVINDDGLLLYKENLKEGSVFTSNEFNTYYVVDKGMWNRGDELIVLATNNRDEFFSWSIVSVKIRNGKYVHKSIQRKAGKELSTKFFKYLIGEGELTDEDIDLLDCI